MVLLIFGRCGLSLGRHYRPKPHRYRLWPYVSIYRNSSVLFEVHRSNTNYQSHLSLVFKKQSLDIIPTYRSRTKMATYAIPGATGNCSTALIQNLLSRPPPTKICAYCRNKSKLLRLIPEAVQASVNQMEIFEGSIHDVALPASCLRDCRAVFLVVSTHDNVPGLRVGQDTATGVIRALEQLRSKDSTQRVPRLVLLSSATIDDQLSHNTPAAAAAGAAHVGLARVPRPS